MTQAAYSYSVVTRTHAFNEPEVCTEFTLCGWFRDAKVYERREGGLVSYEIRWRVPDRDDGEPTTLNFVGSPCPAELFRDPEVRTKLFRATLQQLALHEVDEAILLGGERVFDPHKEK